MTSGKPSNKRKGRRGGSGAAGGFDFQARLGAWLACQILADSDASPPWDWPEDSTLQTVHLETGAIVDDLLATNSAGSQAYVQAKVKLSLGASPDSEYGGAIAQLAAQFAESGLPGNTKRNDDRYVLAIGPETSRKIKFDLPRVLQRLRGQSESGDLFDNAGTVDEKQALKVTISHARAGWKSATGKDMNPTELRGFLRRVRVHTFDLSDEGSETRSGKESLRRSVLADGSASAQAWKALIALAAKFSSDQSGADRLRLRETLQSDGLALRATSSYRQDTERLTKHSLRMLPRLRSLSSISLSSGATLKISRNINRAVETALSESSLLVTGDPGVGKSAAFFELADRLINDDRDVVVLMADSFKAESSAELRDELQLDHELIEVLQEWTGLDDGVLIVEAIDSARGDFAQEVFVQLIAEVSVTAPRWNIGASIRRFDLRYNPVLRDLFPVEEGAPVPMEYQATEFWPVRHLVVPLLSDSELSSLEELAPDLHAVLKVASADLVSLVRAPFNLRLLSELVSMNVDADEIKPIRTQIDLLNRYWEHRVIKAAGGGSEERERLLRQVVAGIVDGRGMEVARSALTLADVDTPLSALLSENVLAERENESGAVERDQLAFSHHVLFDYSVARLMLRVSDDEIAELVASQPELVLIVRPSFDFHFRYLWELDATRTRFWDLALRLASDERIPKIGRIVAAAVAIDLIGDNEDFGPLLNALESPDGAIRTGADYLTRHLIGTAYAADETPWEKESSKGTAWCRFAASLSDQCRIETIYPLNQLTWKLAESAPDLTEQQLDDLGRAARTEFEFAMGTEQLDRALTKGAIVSVVATFSSDPDGSRALIRGLLTEKSLQAHGYLLMPDLADETEALIDLDPGLTCDIYKAVFGHEESSDEETSMGGIVMALNSNRRQDFDHSKYSLAKSYPKFLEKRLPQAIEALVAIRANYRTGDRSKTEPQRIITFPWKDGRQARVLADHGYVWDHEPFEHHHEVKTLNSFEVFISETATPDQELLESIINQIVDEEAPASIWIRILKSASSAPPHFAGLIQSFVVSPIVMDEPELNTALGQFLTTGFYLYSEEVRKTIETNLINLPAFTKAKPGSTDHDVQRAESIRDRLLSTLPEEYLVTGDAKDRRAELAASGQLPENVPPIRISRSRFEDEASSPVDERTSEQKALDEKIAEISAFNSTFLNKNPSKQQVDEIAESIEQVWAAINESQADPEDDRMRRAFGSVAEASEIISRPVALDCSDHVTILVKEILLDASNHPEPSRHNGTEEQFEEHPSWGSPAPRANAAQGLANLALHEECVDDELKDALLRLSTDPIPVVRMLLVGRLPRLGAHLRDLQDQIVEQILETEESRQVVIALLEVLPGLPEPEGRSTMTVLTRSFERFPDGSAGAQQLRTLCVSHIAQQYVWLGDESALEFLQDNVISQMDSRPDEMHRMLLTLRDAIDKTSLGKEETRRRAYGLLEQALDVAAAAFETATEDLAGRTDLRKESPEIEAARNVAKSIDVIATEAYFASGAFDDGSGSYTPLDNSDLRTLYNDLCPVFDRLANVPLPSATHHVVEALETFIDIDPRGVFIRISNSIKGGVDGRYQFDSMGSDLFAKIVERYLAEHRALIQRDEEVRAAFIKMLDIFVEAGSPKARRLAYGLHELFR